jgi:purine-binding chemotaxis protein CheW
MNIMVIREIRAWTRTTPLPNAPDYILGVVNLRGTVLPVFDLSARMGWQATEPTERHVIIVVEIEGQLRGMIVDAVSDIVSAQDEDIQPPPATARSTAADFLEGVVAHDDHMVMVIRHAALSGDFPIAEAA